MRVKDLQGVIFDSVCIYKEVSDMDFRDLYSGKSLSSVPSELLGREVKTVGAKRKGIVDIEIR